MGCELQKHFFQCGDGDSIGLYAQDVLLLVHLQKQRLKLFHGFQRQLIAEFGTDILQQLRIGDMLVNQQFDVLIGLTRGLHDGQIVANPIFVL